MIYMFNQEWRLIIDAPGSGAWNMSVDESILEHVVQKVVQPTLRLYTWNPYCLSLGYAQSYRDVNLDYLHQKGWALVRRPTGGKAILHADELTYSINAPQDNPVVNGSVLESYQRLSKALLYALKVLGIQADSKIKQNKVDNLSSNAICFETPSDYEITCQGKKIIGSAQARRLQGVLQHGAIPLFGAIDRITQVLHFNSEFERQTATANLNLRAANLQSILNRKISWEVITEAVIKGFETELGLNFIQETLSEQEYKRAHELTGTKYSNDNWTMRM